MASLTDVPSTILRPLAIRGLFVNDVSSSRLWACWASSGHFALYAARYTDHIRTSMAEQFIRLPVKPACTSPTDYERRTFG